MMTLKSMQNRFMRVVNFCVVFLLKLLVNKAYRYANNQL